MRSDSHQDSDRDGIEPEAWDAHDPRRQTDQFAPPTEPCECFCLHCKRTFSSEKIWFQKVNGARDGMEGFWMCPTPNCGGAGFTFDIFPVDPSHPANEGWFHTDEEGEETGEADSFDADEDETADDEDDDVTALFDDDDESNSEYDPSEPLYKSMDQWSDDDDDMEGEEWKLGLEPGQRPEITKPDWAIEEEKKYDEPDERPRELDWTDMERPERGGSIGDDDIPF